jgi:hypothetical protein
MPAGCILIPGLSGIVKIHRDGREGDSVMHTFGGRYRILCLLLIGASLAGAPRGAPPSGSEAAQFASLVSRLSEPGGFFDTDNLISNEASYLHVLGRMRKIGTSGGAYVGVGPDQNFSYIAAVRPKIAFILDIRRDNLLLHLMFKALFHRSRNRMEYLCRLFGRPPPDDVEAWNGRPTNELLDRVGRRSADAAFSAAEADALVAAARKTGIGISLQDEATIRRYHRTFVAEGLDLKFASYYRSPRPYYPSVRRLIEERDLEGRAASYLADEAAFRFVRELQEADGIIPVVGDLAGPKALAAIGREVASRGEAVSALYVSNAEMYLWRNGGFDRFAATAASLPRDPRSVIIRSYFGSADGGRSHPLGRSGYASVQLLQTIDDFASRLAGGGWGSYWDLVTQGAR